MALEKLKSVFSDIQPVFEKDISELSTTLGYGESSKIKSTNFIYEYLPDGTGTRVSDQFAPNLNNSPKTSFKIDNTDIFPILDNVQRGSSHQFISEDLTTKFYNIEKFDPRVGRARGPILNINTYQGKYKNALKYLKEITSLYPDNKENNMILWGINLLYMFLVWIIEICFNLE